MFSAVDIVESLLSYPDVDHDPLHDASDAKEDGKKPVRPKTPFARDKAQYISDVIVTSVKHPGELTAVFSMDKRVNSAVRQTGQACNF